MNKLTKVVVSSALGMAALAAPMFAEQLNRLQVSVPFAFSAGKTAFPAGDYTVVQENGGGLLMIEGIKGSALMVTSAGHMRGFNESNGLSFQRVGKNVVLKEVHFAGQASSVVPSSTFPK